MKNVRTITFYLVGGAVTFTVGAANVTTITILQDGSVGIATTIAGQVQEAVTYVNCPFSWSM